MNAAPIHLFLVIPQQPQGGGGAVQPIPIDTPQQAPTDTGTQQPTGQPPGAAPQTCFQPSGLVMVAAMFAILYFMLIRPQQKQEKERRAMLAALKAGDSVVTTGGIHGKVARLSAETVALRIDERVEITVDRAQIARVAGGDAAAAKT